MEVGVLGAAGKRHLGIAVIAVDLDRDSSHPLLQYHAPHFLLFEVRLCTNRQETCERNMKNMNNYSTMQQYRHCYSSFVLLFLCAGDRVK